MTRIREEEEWILSVSSKQQSQFVFITSEFVFITSEFVFITCLQWILDKHWVDCHSCCVLFVCSPTTVERKAITVCRMRNTSKQCFTTHMALSVIRAMLISTAIGRSHFCTCSSITMHSRMPRPRHDSCQIGLRFLISLFTLQTSVIFDLLCRYVTENVANISSVNCDNN